MPRFCLAWKVFLFSAAIAVTGCTGSNDYAPRTLTTTPGAVDVRLGNPQPFSASADGRPTSAVTWSVNGITGGNSTVGAIDSAGNYTAPNALPNPNTVTVQAANTVNPAVSGTSVARAHGMECAPVFSWTSALGSSYPAQKMPRGRWNLKLRETTRMPFANSAEATVSPSTPTTTRPSNRNSTGVRSALLGRR